MFSVSANLPVVAEAFGVQCASVASVMTSVAFTRKFSLPCSIHLGRVSDCIAGSSELRSNHAFDCHFKRAPPVLRC